MLGNKPLVHIEEHDQERVVSFAVNCQGPEAVAWHDLRHWAVANLSDYRTRRYIGCAPQGHHPQGEAHQPDEEIGTHEYLAQVFLDEQEEDCDTFRGASVRAAPQGLYLVGDVAMNAYRDDGTIDMGSSMEKAFGIMVECLKNMGGYVFELQTRPYYEEHIFANEWFGGKGELAGFKLWLPIRKL